MSINLWKRWERMGKYMSIHTAECKCFSSPLPVQVLVHLSSTSPDHGCAELPMLLFFLLTPISSFLRLTSNSGSCEPYLSGSLLLRCKNEVQVFLKPAYFSSKSPCMICAGSLLWTEYSRSSQCRGCTRPWRRSCPQNDNALMGVFIEVCQHHGRSTELCNGWKLYRWVVQCTMYIVCHTLWRGS